MLKLTVPDNPAGKFTLYVVVASGWPLFGNNPESGLVTQMFGLFQFPLPPFQLAFSTTWACPQHGAAAQASRAAIRQRPPTDRREDRTGMAPSRGWALRNIRDLRTECTLVAAQLQENNRQQDKHSPLDRKSTRLNSSHANISYAVFCLKKK